MCVIFKRGHIIPRWCHVKTSDRKAQHCIKFGCDVEVNVIDGVVRIRALSTGVVVDCRGKRGASRRMKGGSTKYSVTTIRNVHVDFSKLHDTTTIQANGFARMGATP